MRPLFLHDIETLKREGMLARGERVRLIYGLILKLRITSMWRKSNLPLEFLLGFMQLQHPDGEKVTESQCREHALMHDPSCTSQTSSLTSQLTHLIEYWAATGLRQSSRTFVVLRRESVNLGDIVSGSGIIDRWSRNIKEK